MMIRFELISPEAVRTSSFDGFWNASSTLPHFRTLFCPGWTRKPPVPSDAVSSETASEKEPSALQQTGLSSTESFAKVQRFFP